MCELTFHIHCHPHANPASTSLWTKTCDSSFSLVVELKRRRARLRKKTPELFFCYVLQKQSPCSLQLAWTALKLLENTTSPTVPRVATFFCKLAPDWLARMQRRLWLAESVLLTEGGLPESRGRWKRKKRKKNSSYKTTPCASPEWGWNNHREDACTQKYIKLWQRLTILELPRNDFTCSARFYGHNRRRPPAMTPHNYTGNFVLTPAVSMDANRSANSLLPQLVWLLLLPTLQSFTDGVQRSKYARKWLRQPAPSF